MDRGWAPMLDNLRIYLTHFTGQPVTPVHVSATFSGTPEEAIDRVRAALGVRSVGEHVERSDSTRSSSARSRGTSSSAPSSRRHW
jgi:hypothetical protein